MKLFDFSGFRRFNFRFHGFVRTANGVIGSQSPGLALIGSHNSSSLGISSQSFIDGFEHGSDLHSGKPAGSTGLIEGQSRGIGFVRVVRVSDRPGGFNGHVYNLQTDSEMYSTHGIITHNCRCYVTPQLEAFDVFIRHLTAGQYRDWMNHAA